MKSAIFQIGKINKGLTEKLEEKNSIIINNNNNIQDNEEKNNNTSNTNNQSNKPIKIVENVYYFN